MDNNQVDNVIIWTANAVNVSSAWRHAFTKFGNAEAGFHSMHIPNTSGTQLFWAEHTDSRTLLAYAQLNRNAEDSGWTLWNVVVAKQARRQGLAENMIACMKRFVQERTKEATPQIELLVAVHNSAAQKLYAKSGFVQRGRAHTYGSEPVLSMVWKPTRK